MSGHTKGPWILTIEPFSITVHAGHYELSEQYFPDSDLADDRAEIEVMKANANLIAAAPELLECLEEMLEFAKKERWISNSIVKSMAAIAHAKGEK